jgi:hypothetical protein
MAYVVAKGGGRFEVRESRSSEKGPRSRTLASFRQLSPAVIEKARQRAEKPPSARELELAAIKAGAQIQGSRIDEAVRTTLRLLGAGERPDPMLRRLLLDALDRENRSDRPAAPGAPVSDAARSATEWIGVAPEDRAKTLRDLLELTDALPVRPRPHEVEFPRLKSA